MKANAFKFSYLTLAVASLCYSLPALAAPSKGDLSVYAKPEEGGSPTLMFMIETSTFMSQDDGSGWISRKEEVNNDPYHGIKYTRIYNGKLFTPQKDYTRISRLKDSIFYLLNTPGAIPDDFKIGVGRYQATPSGSRTKTEYDTSPLVSSSGGIFIPAKPIGGDPEACKGKDKTVPANKCGMYSEQRKLIKTFISALCNTGLKCLGESPMAWAYAEAGAYMMGTKTAPLRDDETKLPTIYTLESVRLRGRNSIGTLDPAGITLNKKWQICPENKQVLVNYYANIAPLNHNYRLDCKEEDWVDLDKNNASQYKFGGNTLEWNSFLANRPHGIAGPHPLFNPRLHFTYDLSASTLRGGGWNYFIDARNKPTIKIPSRHAIAGSFMGSGIRNAPIEVRDGNSYKYKQPDIDECTGVVIPGSGGGNNGGDQEAGAQNGIIFFTSGFNRSSLMPLPTHANSRYNSKTNPAENVMNMSFSPFESNVINTTAAGGDIDCAGSGLSNRFIVLNNPLNNNWHCIGGYAKRLNSANNPIKKKIKTGVFLFAAAKEYYGPDSIKNGMANYDCDKAKTLGVKNACLLGTKEYGGGGFLQTTPPTADDANEQLVAMINNFKKPDEDSGLGLVPTDMPVVPANPFYPNALMPEGYLPLAKPDVTGTDALWQGNLRKYKVKGSGFEDKKGNSPFSTEVEDLLAATTLDFWSSATEAYKSKTLAGGAYEKLPYPLKDSNVPMRSVYLEPASGKTLNKLQPTAAAMKAISVSDITDGGTNAAQDKLRTGLLKFLGFNVNFVSNHTDPSKNTTDAGILASADAGASTRSLGGVIHSKPVMVSYKASIDEATGKATSTSNKVIFGALDNALHVVDATTGKEEMAFIPRATLAGEGYKSLSAGNTVAKGPNFGVDAPWAADVTYAFNDDGSKMTANRVNVYGGLRLGGTNYYGLDIKNLKSPKLLFRIGADQSDFDRMGYTWAKPVITHIKWEGKRKKVLIVPAGYDTAYDTPDDERTNKTDETKGNAVYVVDADTGELLISIGKSDNSNMKYSIVGAPKVMDRDADDLTDHIYFADLNGQVFRADINNHPFNSAEAEAKVTNVVRIAALSGRFYETPVVTIHKAGSKRFAVVSVASGDRSNPSHKNAVVNNVYAVFDKDVTRKDLFEVTESELYTKDISVSAMLDKPSKADVPNLLSTNAQKRKDGWYQPLNRFGSGDAQYLKALGAMSAIDNDLYVSVYNYHDNDNVNKCAASVRGKTEANQFCLPYGFCEKSDGSVYSVNRQRFTIGKGIMPVTYGAPDEEGLNRTILTQSTEEPEALEKGSGAPKLAKKYEFNYVLKPTRWFDMSYQKPKN